MLVLRVRLTAVHSVCIISIIRVPQLRGVSQTDPSCAILMKSFRITLLTVFRDLRVRCGMVFCRMLYRHAERLPPDNATYLQLDVQSRRSRERFKIPALAKDVLFAFKTKGELRHVSRPRRCVSKVRINQ